MTSMRDGDYFRWSYKTLPKGSHEPYWCCSRIARVWDGRLRDTYWHSGDGRQWPLNAAVSLLNLEFIANESDLVPASAGVYDDHRPEDIVDLSHANGGAVYLRKGANRDMETQRATWRQKRDSAQAKADMYQHLLDSHPSDAVTKLGAIADNT